MPVITINYNPRKAFLEFHRRQARWAVIVAHRRAGKTVCCINDLIKRALQFPRNDGRFAYIAPYLKQAKDVAWDYLKRFSAPIPGIKTNESELTIIYPNGSRIRLYGADNGESLRGIYLDGCVVDEPADMDDEFWASVLRPALSDRKGWCVWIGTPKGRNGFYRLYDAARLDNDWFTMVLKASESGIIDQYELQAALQSMGKTVYQREYECDFSAAIDGSIYGEQISLARLENRIRPFKVDPRYPLFTFWDIGQSDFTAIWLMQFIGRDICICDYLCRNGEAPAFYATAVKDWERNLGTRVMANYLPHDANNTGPSGQSYLTYLRDAELPGEIKVVPRTPDVWLGIHELRSLLPRAYINSETCSINWKKGERVYPSGLDVLEYYHSKEVTECGTICERPVHDEFSHGADAIRTMAEAHRLGMIAGNSTVAKQSRDSNPVANLRRAITVGYSNTFASGNTGKRAILYGN